VLLYWRAWVGCGTPPEQLTVFILGEYGYVRRLFPVQRQRRLSAPATPFSQMHD
jgi:hypothetical protein